ncbi:MAG: type III secretion system cytoplasmic ring protein SctQ, partial [Deltaproteobacteria bacterium]|nr:type III secretion system cytoplasmic ring protein SctQ [Deltaproteobacteria bacterium]
GSTARAIPASIGDVGVALGIRVGRARLSAGEVRSLGVGDVLLPDELAAERHEGAPRWSEARLVGRGGGVVVRLSRGDEGWRVEGVERASVVRSATIVEETMSEDAQAVRTDELSEVAEVPVELAIELGRIELRVRELAALVPGRVISARLPVGREVTLRAGDRVVAEGELVDIDGELGVRITRVARS